MICNQTLNNVERSYGANRCLELDLTQLDLKLTTTTSSNARVPTTSTWQSAVRIKMPTAGTEVFSVDINQVQRWHLM